MRRSLRVDTHALSVMYDAVFFVVLVSLSGAVLLPAMYDSTAVETSLMKHREETVDEALLVLMTARDDDFSYQFAGEQIDEYIGDYLYDEQGEPTFLYTVVDTLVGKQQKHKTYMDLIVENLACQLQVFEHRLNVFTTEYDTAIQENIDELLTRQLGSKYQYHVTVHWYPVEGVAFGGAIDIGTPPPLTDTHVASCLVSMPRTPFVDFWEMVSAYIPDQVQDLEDAYQLFLANPDDGGVFRDLLEQTILDLIQGILFDGFTTVDGEVSGVVDGVIDYVFGMIQQSFEQLFDEPMSMISDSIDVFEGFEGYTSLDEGFTESLLAEILSLPGIDQYLPGDIDLSASIDGLKTYVRDLIASNIQGVLEDAVVAVVDGLMDVIQATGLDQVALEIMELLTMRLQLLQARCTLTIWEDVA